jgi:hypothetical protein
MRSQKTPEFDSSRTPPRLTRSTLSFAPIALAAALASTGCLTRPVSDATPTTTNLVVQTLATNNLTKIDLLFMIDNSRSMADKQTLLKQAVPILLGRLVTPNCLNDAGAIIGAADTLGRCAAGTPEFRPIRDIHIGIITSSLGSHGGSECTPGATDVRDQRTPDDRAELLPTANPAVRGPLPSWNDSGFLVWDPGQDKHTPPGEHNFTDLRSAFEDQVSKAGEYGCGYEASLEAWYRFLVDPEPPVSVSASNNYTRQGPVNQALLAQRDAFLRPDSLLAIVMLTDENDCSITDQEGSQGFLASTTGSRLPRASAACAADPNDRCCHSCALEAEPGCTPNAEDAECSKPAGTGPFPYLSDSEDDSFLRCFDQKRRFGLDFLYPVQRYIDGLTKPMVPNRAGVDVPNPIFAPNAQGERRSKELVLLAGIVGVPWQDLSTRESWSGADLEYLNADGLEREGRWPLILGSAGVPPTDPLMRESVAPRSGTHPLLGVPIVPPGSGQPDNPVNGHEQLASNDLQFACTFRVDPRLCTNDNCDCTPKDRAKQSPLCTYPDDPMAPGTQVAAKAYPGTRHLEVLKGLGKNAIVASICPKNTRPAAGLSEVADRAYGYNPAIAALLDLMKARFPTQCLPRRLEVESNPASPDFGQVPCVVVEAAPKRNGACSCDPDTGRIALGANDGDLPQAVVEQMRALAVCDGTSGVSCKDYCQCKIAPLEGEQLSACQAGSEDANLYGYCYVDPAQGIGREELVKECAPTARRMLRFPGDGLPANGATTFMACFGAQLDAEEPNATP